MSKLSIIKASAGSGKTHQLTWNILRLLFHHKQPDYFKHILAVTFTNKATEEMKSRLIAELHKLAGGENTPFYTSLIKSGHTDAVIREKASQIIRHILHEYSWLSVETIDSFFQRVIRAFTRELGLPGNYRIELDTEMVLELAVNRLIDSLGDDEDLLRWLQGYAESKIDEGKAWDFQSDLLDLGKELFREHFSAHARQLQDLFGDREMMEKFRDELVLRKDRFERKFREIGRRGLAVIDAAGLSDGDFFRKSTGVVPLFRRMRDLELTNKEHEPLSRQKLAEHLLEDVENWPANDSANKDAVRQLAGSSLLPLLQEAVRLMDREFIDYESVKAMIRNLYGLGILVDLSQKIREYRTEENSFLLNDSPLLIHRLINHNDTPFIYEKMGNRYRHYLIDEFQDTSRLQWDNFKPLIRNALAQHEECFLVGDAKQSIYRWRNGDWEILARRIYEEFIEEELSPYTLNTNWRSQGNIVRFNSGVFAKSMDLMADYLQRKTDSTRFSTDAAAELLREVYSDVVQELPHHIKDPGKGNVLFRFFGSKEIKGREDYFEDSLTDALNELFGMNYNLKDIAIIVREKKQGMRVGEFLLRAGKEGRFSRDVQFVSDESLFLGSSVAVSVLIAALRYISDKEPLHMAEMVSALLMLKDPGAREDIAWKTLLSDAGGTDLIPDGFVEASSRLALLPLYEMAERLIGLFDLRNLQHELAYLHAFLDVVFGFTRQEKGSLKDFLDYWDERGRTKSVPASDSQEAVRILTIHKSKGLEFEAVILPFCDWDFSPKAGSIFWVDVPEGFSEQTPLFPVHFSAALQNTVFAEGYYTELFRTCVDNLNLLYVAMTRARESLIAFPVFRENADNSEAESVGDLLYHILTGGGPEPFTGNFNREEGTFRIGFGDKHLSEQPGRRSDTYGAVSPGFGQPAADRLFLGRETAQYFMETGSLIMEGKIRGRYLHSLLADIITIDDLEPALSRAVREGGCSAVEAAALKKHIESCLKEQPAAAWFDGSGEVINESAILLPDGKLRRPDRVVAWKDRTHIIDYKFGSDKEDPGHSKQVAEYVHILRKMGFVRVRGFLWYLDMNEVIETKIQEGG